MKESTWLDGKHPGPLVKEIMLGGQPRTYQAIVRMERKFRLWCVALYMSSRPQWAGRFPSSWLTGEPSGANPHDAVFDEAQLWCSKSKDLFGDLSMRKRADLLRDIFGDRGRPVDMERWKTPQVIRLAQTCNEELPGILCPRCEGRGFHDNPNVGGVDADGFPLPIAPAATVRCRRCQGSRRLDNGAMNPDNLSVLADALTDEGCDNVAILRHLRGFKRCSLCAFAGEEGDLPVWCGECGDGKGWLVNDCHHVRGCWVIDGLLSKV